MVFPLAATLLVASMFPAKVVMAQSSGGQTPTHSPLQVASNKTSVLTPPGETRPVLVKAAFDLRDITEIDDLAETFEFSGILRLIWKDKRQAFDPDTEGVAERVYQGDYQFNELSPSWYPEVVLANVSGMTEQYGVVLRVQPDGTNTLTTKLSAIAEVNLDMRRHPFDTQKLGAVFEIIGFNDSEVRFIAEPPLIDQSWEPMEISQWRIEDVASSTGRSIISEAGRKGASSTFIVTFEVHRKSYFVVRLVVIPLALIVALSWSVFWMERSSLGDRISVSFIGILTAVAYQEVISDLLPHMSYMTLMNGFVNLSLLIMCATVVVNLVVGAYDNRGKSHIGDLIDYRCRWGFPLIYVTLLLAMTAAAFL